MSKAAADRDRYYEALSRAQAAARAGNLPAALRAARESLPHIDGMMQYETKKEDRAFDSIDAIDLILRFAPLLLDREALDEVSVILKAKKRIERDTDADMGNKLAEARQRLDMVYRLLTRIEQFPGSEQHLFDDALGGSQDTWRALADSLTTIGIIRRVPHRNSYRVWLTTELDRPVPARCVACGHQAELPMARTYHLSPCPSCSTHGHHVRFPERSHPEEQRTSP
jgi:hypothetical protein